VTVAEEGGSEITALQSMLGKGELGENELENDRFI
jgi:hypothetical protein